MASTGGSQPVDIAFKYDDSGWIPSVQSAGETVKDSLLNVAIRIRDEFIDDPGIVQATLRHAVEVTLRIWGQSAGKIALRKLAEAMENLLSRRCRRQPAQNDQAKQKNAEKPRQR